MPTKQRRNRKQRQQSRRRPKSAGHRRLNYKSLIHKLVNDCTQYAGRLLHLQKPVPQTPIWKYFPLVLGLAFAVRATVALAGDFILHPDEVMQYLEPAHRLVFGNGLVFWEYYYGARSWLTPGLVAGVLWLCKTFGLGEPHWYVPAVRLVFCFISLAIPAGMYFFARRHFSETSARLALLAGAFWYELVVLAHKPMTEFTASALLMILLVLCMRPLTHPRLVWATAAVALLTVAVRMQYAPLALLLLGLVFLNSHRKKLLIIASALIFLIIGAFDALTWGSIPFHSYLTNFRFNLSYPFSGMPDYQYLKWLLIASTGLGLLCIMIACGSLRRYGLLLLLLAITLVIHSTQLHKEYRFIFATIPLWLLLGADLLALLLARANMRPLAVTAISVFAVISVAGGMNALPHQDLLYKVFGSDERGDPPIRFIGNSSRPMITAYRYLARSPDIFGLLHHERIYPFTPGYYYLHHQIPFYDHFTGHHYIKKTLDNVLMSVSHIMTSNPGFAIPGFSEVKTLGDIRILRRDDNTSPVKQWQEYAPVLIPSPTLYTVKKTGISNREPPPNHGIRYVEK